MNTQIDALTLKDRLKRRLKSGWRDYWRPWIFTFEQIQRLYRRIVD
ncbi:hypothetical protein [Paraburkholderia oxyphila]|nr:hypothetical protein [Paraburkholderia oxyphila]